MWGSDIMEEQDKKLPEKLRAELPGILAWAVEGCLEWQREGLKATLKDVYERYEAWCEEGGERAETKRKFNARLTERGEFVDRRSGPGGLREWHGLGLLTKRNAGFAGKLTKSPQNDYNELNSTSRSGNGTSSVSSSVTSVDEPIHRDPEAFVEETF